jgi:hypothetical protein
MVANSVRIRVRVPSNHVGHRGLRDKLVNGSPFRQGGAPKSNARPWFGSSTALQASLSLIGLFTFALPPAKFSPACILGLERSALPVLDACIYGDYQSPVLREKLDLLIGVCKIMAEIWPIAKTVAEEVNSVTKDLVPAAVPATTMPAVPEIGWDAFINGILPPNLTDSTNFYFPQPRTAEDLNQWSSYPH